MELSYLGYYCFYRNPYDGLQQLNQNHKYNTFLDDV
jgi:hypothetical protein